MSFWDVDVAELFFGAPIIKGLEVVAFGKRGIPNILKRSGKNDFLQVLAISKSFYTDFRHSFGDIDKRDRAAVEAIGPNILHFRRDVDVLEEFILRENAISEFLN